MKTIVYYVSDHGWGHAARAIPVLRALLEYADGVRIWVKASSGFELLEGAFKGDHRVQLACCRKDFGVLCRPGTMETDVQSTERRLREWISSWREFVEQEVQWSKLQGIDLVVSDIAPQPFLVAEVLGIPSVALSNFTWHGIYRALFGPTRDVQAVEDAYRKAALGLIAPLAEETLPFPESEEIGLVGRKVTMPRYAMRQELGIHLEVRLIYVGSGGTGQSEAVEMAVEALADQVEPDRVEFLVPWYVQEVSHRPTELLLRIPRDATDSQSYIAACDLVVSKPGYSTVSEAIAGRVPMLLLQRDGFSEDDAIIDAVEDLGIGHRIDSIQALKSLDLEAACAMRAAYDHLPDRYRRDGNLEAAERILELL